MFDLSTGELKHAPRPRAVPVVASVVAHAAFALAIFAATAFLVSEPPPAIHTMMAFVAAPPMPTPPSPPLAPPAVKAQAQRKAVTPAPIALAPIDVPITLAPEATAPDFDDEFDAVGVEGGVPGGIVGGVVGAIEIPPPPLSPPPLVPAARAPIRVGGEVEAPALVYRVDPVYPTLAAAGGLEGSVILEAIVGREGRVESVRVLRSQRVFEEAALEAVRQWRYAPVLLNGHPERFILTVVVTFTLDHG